MSFDKGLLEKLRSISSTNEEEDPPGKTGRQLGQRIKEHKSSAPSRIPSAVKEHSPEAHHTIDCDNVKILDREDREFPRQVKEAIQIRKHSPALNRDQGLEIPSIYNVIIRPKVIKGQ